jgi:hypothetical protein
MVAPVRRRRVAGVALAAALAWPALLPAPALAQDRSAAIADVPDVVKLQDGSLYRGTIVELVTGDHVDLRLPSGQVKRWPMADVSFAGAADHPPPPSPPPRERPAPRPLVTVDADEARIHFESDTPETDLHIRTSDTTVTGAGWGGRGAFVYGAVGHHYEHICAAPCDATLPAGTHRLALSFRGKVPIEPDEAVTVRGPSKIQGTYTNRSGTRVAGLAVAGGSLAASLVMMIASIRSSQDCTYQPVTGTCDEKTSIDTGMAVAAGSVLGIGMIVGLILVMQRDSAAIEVTPLDVSLRAPSLARREQAWMAPGSAGASGLGVRIRF